MTVGSKVVCVDDDFPPEIAVIYTTLPIKDEVYIIREMKIGVNFANEPGEVCLYLVGIHNPRSNVKPFPERGFNAERFRPLEEVEADIAGKVRLDCKAPVCLTPPELTPA